MDGNSFQVEIVSPDELLYSGYVTILVAQTTNGEVGILAGHTPLLGQLADGGYVSFTELDCIRRFAAVTGGFISVSNERVTVLAETAEWVESVDVAAETMALESAETGTTAYFIAKSRLAAYAALSR